jgi:cytochrome c oxidase subunit 1
MAIGFFLTAIYLIHSLFKGARAPKNPWGGVTLEWEAQSPPVHYNFDGDAPKVGDPYDFERVEYDRATRSYRHKPLKA